LPTDALCHPPERIHEWARDNVDAGALGDAATATKLTVSDSELLSVVEEVPDSMEEVPDAVEEVPDVNEMVDCPRCRKFHAGGAFGEACREARRNARKCARCGLFHEGYDLITR
jgi:hypothetical protein